jgi:hypothetical protein
MKVDFSLDEIKALLFDITKAIDAHDAEEHPHDIRQRQRYRLLMKLGGAMNVELSLDEIKALLFDITKAINAHDAEEYRHDFRQRQRYRLLKKLGEAVNESFKDLPVRSYINE